MPRMWRALEEHGSLVRGLVALGKRKQVDLPGPRVPRTSLLSFPDGLREIVAALERALRENGATLRTQCAASRVERAQDRARWRVETKRGERFEAGDLVLAVPAPAAVRLLGSGPTRDLPLETLRRIVHARVTLVHLGFERSELSSFPAGFGYLVPPPPSAMQVQATARGVSAAASGEPLVLGTIFTSSLFPGRAPRGCIAVTSFYKTDDVERMNEKDLIDQACRDLALALRESRVPAPRVALSQRWTDVIPHYAPGHADRMQDLLRRAIIPDFISPAATSRAFRSRT
jgi:protoporphyrinogen/coproporphyrinogen III oxidase